MTDKRKVITSVVASVVVVGVVVGLILAFAIIPLPEYPLLKLPAGTSTICSDRSTPPEDGSPSKIRTFTSGAFTRSPSFRTTIVAVTVSPAMGRGFDQDGRQTVREWVALSTDTSIAAKKS